ncbi:ABC transporter ATP-binding protein [Chromatiales bacterium (ex Bugula neritina AB1)]|nr:ABC transporter ATP-binding protein [Chromatiales bacterium (ex Bugula neritina AB1)]
MLELDSVSAGYGKARILNDLSLKVDRGQVVALLGRNGAGKSTTMKTVIGLLAATAGRVKFLGEDITRFPCHRTAQLGVGYVPEDRRVFPELSVDENLEVGRQPPREGFTPWSADALFKLFPNLLERRKNLGKQLSGGEQQMLTIARTLMGNPQLILLDEPSEGLAPRIVEQMAETIIKLKASGMTVLLSEQNLHFARLVADHAYVIEKGSVCFDGSIAALDDNPEILATYLAV